MQDRKLSRWKGDGTLCVWEMDTRSSHCRRMYKSWKINTRRYWGRLFYSRIEPHVARESTDKSLFPSVEEARLSIRGGVDIQPRHLVRKPPHFKGCSSHYERWPLWTIKGPRSIHQGRANRQSGCQCWQVYLRHNGSLSVNDTSMSTRGWSCDLSYEGDEILVLKGKDEL